jgi:hypothetical protein
MRQTRAPGVHSGYTWAGRQAVSPLRTGGGPSPSHHGSFTRLGPPTAAVPFPAVHVRTASASGTPCWRSRHAPAPPAASTRPASASLLRSAAAPANRPPALPACTRSMPLLLNAASPRIASEWQHPARPSRRLPPYALRKEMAPRAGRTQATRALPGWIALGACSPAPRSLAAAPPAGR